MNDLLTNTLGAVAITLFGWVLTSAGIKTATTVKAIKTQQMRQSSTPLDVNVDEAVVFSYCPDVSD